MLAKCTHTEIAKIRKTMIKKIHRIIDKTLRHGKEKMAINPIVTEALTKMWSADTIQHISAPTADPPAERPDMQHVWDWVSDEATRECLKDITKPGARLMWAGTFTKNWTTNMTKMGINEATALKLARKIRKQIMTNTSDIWRTRCDATHDNRKREETHQKMQEVADEAHSLGALTDPKQSVQRALEMHKGLAEKKKWIKRIEKRIAAAKKAKIFAMSRNFRKFFSTNVVPKLRDSAQNPISTSDEDDDDVTAANRAKTRATPRKRTATELTDTDHSDEEDHGITKTKPISARDRAAKELDSTDSDDGGPQERLTTSTSANTTKNPHKRSADTTHTRTNKPRRRREKESQERPSEMQTHPPPTGGAAAAGGAGRGSTTSMQQTLHVHPGKRKPKRYTSGSAKKQKAATAEAPESRKRKQETKREKKRKRETQQQTMRECVQRRPSKRPNHTSREQEVAEEQQNRAQSEYDTG